MDEADDVFYVFVGQVYLFLFVLVSYDHALYYLLSYFEFSRLEHLKETFFYVEL